MAFSRTQLHHGQVIYALAYTYPLLYAPLFLRLFALTRLANIHRFLIYVPHFGLKPFCWLRFIMLRPTYSLISYGNIICDLRLSISAPFFRNTASAHSKRFCVRVLVLPNEGKGVPVHAMTIYWGVKWQLIFFFYLGATWSVRGQYHTLAAVLRPKSPNTLWIGIPLLNYSKYSDDSGVPRGGFGEVQTPPPAKIPKFWQSRNGLQIEQKMFSVHILTP